jgi:hypothetical protein
VKAGRPLRICSVHSVWAVILLLFGAVLAMLGVPIALIPIAFAFMIIILPALGL